MALRTVQKVESKTILENSLTSKTVLDILLHVINLLTKMATKNLAFENSHFQKQVYAANKHIILLS
jgi:hypothetical protein